MKIIVALDSFKGCLTSVEANAAACKGVLQKCPDAEVVQVPVSDGGEGWIEAFYAAIGGTIVEANVHDPLMRPIKACYLKKDKLAVIEMAKASGLTLLKPEERNPMVASTFGTGELIIDAIRKVCKRFIVGLGGSATSDAGMGMLQVLLPHIDIDMLGLEFIIATDVTNPLYGPFGAAHVFGPQKGATSEMVVMLDERAKRFAKQSAELMGYDSSENPGAGAAGGIGYAFMQYLHAETRSGIDLLLDEIDFDILLEGADLVITGEGSSDEQTLMGKLPYGIMQRAKEQGVATALIAGKIEYEEVLMDAGFSQVLCINPPDMPLSVAMQKEVAKRNISNTVGFLV